MEMAIFIETINKNPRNNFYYDLVSHYEIKNIPKIISDEMFEYCGLISYGSGLFASFYVSTPCFDRCVEMINVMFSSTGPLVLHIRAHTSGFRSEGASLD